MITRSIAKITENPWKPGFLGTGHRAKPVLDGMPYTDTDPFIVFMDDDLNLPGGEPVGGAHPHAGFETLTLVLNGNAEEWPTGSFELMTAGKGIVHTEEISSETHVRILQVWLVLPPEKRYSQPFWQRILLEDVPTLTTGDHEIRVYSGSSNGLTSPLLNHTPLTLVTFVMKKNAVTRQEIPAHYNGLVYVLKGRVKAGDQIIQAEQAGFLNKTGAEGQSKLILEALDDDTHFVIYAAQPHNVPVVPYGPFVADSMEAIAEMYRDFRHGKFPHLNDLPEDQKVTYTTAIS